MEKKVNSLTERLTIRLEVIPGETVADRVATAYDCGFDGIAFPGRFRDQFGPETLEVLSDLPIPIKTVSLGFEGSLCSPSAVLRQRCRDSLVKLFDFTASLGAISVNMPPVLIMDNPERFPADATEIQNQLLIDQLPGLGDEATARNIDLLIEPVNAFETDYMTTISHAAEICEAVNHPAIGLTPDFYHMQMAELNTAEALVGNMKWIRHIHTAENTRVEPGPGQLDFRPGFHVLKEAGYEGLVEVECRTLSGPASEVLPRSSNYLRREWEEA